MVIMGINYNRLFIDIDSVPYNKRDRVIFSEIYP